MGKKIACILAIAGILCLLLLGGYRYRIYEDEQQMKQTLAIQEETMRTVVDPYKEIAYGNKFLYDTSLRGKNTAEIETLLKEEIGAYKDKQVQLKIGKKVFSYDMETFSFRYYFRTSDGKQFDKTEELAEYIVNMEKDADLETQYGIITGAREPQQLQIEVEHSYDTAAVDALCGTLYKLFYSEGSNAAFRRDKSIIKSTNGTQLNTEKVNKKIQKYLVSEQKKPLEISCKVQDVKPQWTTADLKKCKTVIGEFSTSFSNYGSRGHNVSLGASRINGIFLYPGEQVSFDQLLHDGSDGKSFQSAPSYLNGRTVMTAGGGICQVSSTAYNAILRAGILPVKRFNHSMAVSYVPMGLDATISEGVKDMVVENKLDYPMFLEAVVSGNTLRVRVYSNGKAKDGYTYQPRAVKISALSARAYLDVYKNGKLLESIYMHTDTYLPHA